MSSSAALVRLGFPALPPASARSVADASLRSFHTTFHNAVLKIQGSLICDTPHVRPPIRANGYSISRAGPSAPPLEHQYKALVPISAHRTFAPSAPKGFRDSWQRHLFFAKDNVFHPDFQGRSNVHVTDDFLAAVDKSVELGADAKLWREKRQKMIHKLAKRLVPLNNEIKRLAARAPDHPAARAAPHAHIALLACLIEATSWLDKWLPYNMLYGFNVVGCIKDSGIFRPILPAISENSHLNLVASIAKTNQAQIAYVRRRLRGQAALAMSDPALQSDLDKIFKISEAEWNPPEGVPSMSEGFTAGQLNNKWRPMIRFLVHQERKDRVVDDARQSRTNECARLEETVTLPSFEWGAVYAGYVARAAASRQIPVPAMCIGLDDMQHAYRQVPVKDEGYSIVGIWHPKLNRVLYHQVWGHPFGFTASVPNFSRLPVFICTVARRLFASAVCSYIDDYLTPDLSVSNGSSQASLATLHTCLGFSLSDSKRLDSQSMNVALGVLCDMSKAHSDGVVTFQIPKKSCDRVLTSLREHRASNRMTPAAASKVCGQLGWTLNGVYGRIGRAALGPFFSREHQRVADNNLHNFSPELHRSVEFFEALLQGGNPWRPRTISIFPNIKPPTLLWSDARTSPDHMAEYLKCLRSGTTPPQGLRNKSHRLGFVVVHPLLHPNGIYCHGFCPDEVLLCLSPDLDTMICQLETIAAITAYFTFPELFRDQQCVHWIDNYSAIYALVKGYSASPDMARFSNLLHLQFALINCEAFWDWCPSGANPADPTTRLDAKTRADLHAAGISEHTRTMRFPDMRLWNNPALFFQLHG